MEGVLTINITDPENTFDPIKSYIIEREPINIFQLSYPDGEIEEETTKVKLQFTQALYCKDIGSSVIENLELSPYLSCYAYLFDNNNSKKVAAYNMIRNWVIARIKNSQSWAVLYIYNMNGVGEMKNYKTNYLKFLKLFQAEEFFAEERFARSFVFKTKTAGGQNEKEKVYIYICIYIEYTREERKA